VLRAVVFDWGHTLLDFTPGEEDLLACYEQVKGILEGQAYKNVPAATGRARAGTVRAGQFTGGGHIFAKTPRTFIQKVNRKAHKAALRSALASHAQEGTLAVIDGSQFDAPSTKKARAIVEAWGQQSPTVLVCLQEEQNLSRSFRNLERVAVIGPSEVEVGAVVWARSLLVSEAALPLVQGKAQ